VGHNFICSSPYITFRLYSHPNFETQQRLQKTTLVQALKIYCEFEYTNNFESHVYDVPSFTYFFGPRERSIAETLRMLSLDKFPGNIQTVFRTPGLQGASVYQTEQSDDKQWLKKCTQPRGRKNKED
jgi:hypothetical protein